MFKRLLRVNSNKRMMDVTGISNIFNKKFKLQNQILKHHVMINGSDKKWKEKKTKVKFDKGKGKSEF